MILSIHQFEIRKAGYAKIIATVSVEAVHRDSARLIAQAIVYDRTGVEPQDQEVESVVRIAGLSNAVGDDRRERDRIKRRSKRWQATVAALPAQERQALLAAILRVCVPGRPAALVHAGPSAGPASPAPPRLIPILRRAVISGGAAESRV
jgi:hypothetical protein